MDSNYKYADITGFIIKAFYNVYNKLGYGFLEKVYEKALVIEMDKLGMNVSTQIPIDVFYDGQKVGKYYADLLVDKKVIVELKATECINETHEAQLTNYLRATEYKIGLVLNFGKKAQFKRKAFSNEYKNKS
ncbi:MAG: GxxExxY protein [Ferruginibacter sp.]